MKNDKGEPLFHRNVMLKNPVIKQKESLNETSRKLSNFIYLRSHFLYFIKNEYKHSLSDHKKSYFLGDTEKEYAILSIFLGNGI
ncbi:hypothetical protein [Metabacillus sediminilitoris]|uniref:Uncharacterized protein n=1 Tax=Metabacillus sediminilitoris TaxID=2567941 RepID=A0A4S4C412_9BACI|nr:hypothetical protein [Metabacillus sediminilitoris]QGQ45188.1 hypothetical protein GMB29_07915 [Metabacillus sediminilitoris]THF82513.1 hypothetical protein E6W99_03570 [Metabacillus sediminilitoris]